MNYDKDFWDERYVSGNTGWDIGYASTPIVSYIDGIKNKNMKILIPGCGNAYEAVYFVENGFNDVTLIDISPVITNRLKTKFGNDKNISILNSDFFEHQGKYDLIIEQTFFCSLHPARRESYCIKMNDLLNTGGSISGVLFNSEFEKDGPPFGGTDTEYRELFGKHFQIKTLDKCYNSIQPRMGREVFFILNKKL